MGRPFTSRKRSRLTVADLSRRADRLNNEAWKLRQFAGGTTKQAAEAFVGEAPVAAFMRAETSAIEEQARALYVMAFGLASRIDNLNRLINPEE